MMLHAWLAFYDYKLVQVPKYTIVSRVLRLLVGRIASIHYRLTMMANIQLPLFDIHYDALTFHPPSDSLCHAHLVRVSGIGKLLLLTENKVLARPANYELLLAKDKCVYYALVHGIPCRIEGDFVELKYVLELTLCLCHAPLPYQMPTCHYAQHLLVVEKLESCAFQ